MPSSPSANLRIELQETGESLNSWGTKLNQGLVLLEQAVTGVLRKTISGNTTLVATNYVLDEARNAELIFDPGPGLTGPWVLTIPQVPKSYFIRNLTGYPITITAGGVTGVLATGRQGRVSCIGVDVSVFDPVAAAAAVTEGFATQAATSATSAASSAGTATTAKNTAIDNKNYATEWAVKAVDSLISAAAGGNGSTDYSARHFASKASGSATAAAGSASAASTSATNAANSAMSAASSAASVVLPSATRIYDNLLHYGA